MVRHNLHIILITNYFWQISAFFLHFPLYLLKKFHLAVLQLVFLLKIRNLLFCCQQKVQISFSKNITEICRTCLLWVLAVGPLIKLFSFLFFCFFFNLPSSDHKWRESFAVCVKFFTDFSFIFWYDSIEKFNKTRLFFNLFY